MLVYYWPITLFWKMFGVFPISVQDGHRNTSMSLPTLSTVGVEFVYFVCHTDDRVRNRREVHQ